MFAGSTYYQQVRRVRRFCRCLLQAGLQALVCTRLHCVPEKQRSVGADHTCVSIVANFDSQTAVTRLDSNVERPSTIRVSPGSIHSRSTVTVAQRVFFLFMSKPHLLKCERDLAGLAELALVEFVGHGLLDDLAGDDQIALRLFEAGCPDLDVPIAIVYQLAP